MALATIVSKVEPVSWEERFLLLASEVSMWSKDPSTKVGAVIVDPERRVISVGYNGFPHNTSDSPDLYADRDEKLRRVVHAEANAIVFARQSLDHCTIYVWPFMPCSTCAGLIIQSNISRVVAPPDRPEKWAESFDSAINLFGEAGVELFLL